MQRALLTMKEAAELLGCGIAEADLLRMVRRKRLASYRIAGNVLTSAEDLSEMLERCRVKPQEYASGSGRKGATVKAASPMTLSGSSANPVSRTLALAAARESVAKLISG